ncbi:serine protease 33 [Danaus plexippus plexippus]|uniref:Serine protease 33 n=1 Tax=Danaus plexippus plexippus TaxID=278856 RepID=A0A212F2H0_DANPL|nr:serine protease 33 [Danaus plexippus plexippus]
MDYFEKWHITSCAHCFTKEELSVEKELYSRKEIWLGSKEPKKLEPKCQGPYRTKKVLPNDRFVKEDTPITMKALPLNEAEDMSVFFDHPAITPYIVGGLTAGKVPHMVALTTGVFTRSFTCGGSLVTKKHVLTAAHCIEAVYSRGSLLSSLRGIVGTNRWNFGGVQQQFASNITHPNYVGSIIKNDIGFLVTDAEVSLNDNIQLVPISYDFIEGEVAAVIHGWGRIRTGGSLSPNLLELKTKVIDGERCVSDVARRSSEIGMRVPPVQPDLEVCTFLALNFGNCHGDSGSALLRQSDGQQIGVVSWGLPCARGAPDISLRGIVGTNRWNFGGVQQQFASNITHPNYVGSIIKNDIGFLVTDAEVSLNDNIQLVPISYDFIEGEVAAVIHGWGRIRTGGSLSPNLLELKTKVIDGERCVSDVARRSSEIGMRVPPVQPDLEVCTFLALNFGNCHVSLSTIYT